MIDQDKIETLRQAYEKQLRKMQQPCQARAMNGLMDASEDEIRQFLGEYYDSPEGRKAQGLETKD
jgi:site-specific recombinase XerD